MSASYEYTRLLGELTGLKMQIGFEKQTRPNEILFHLHKHFSEREILILKEGGAIPNDYKTENYKDNG